MSTSQTAPNLKYKIDDKFAVNFDELVNIDVANRKSDIWFSEEEKLMIKMRPWTVQVWWTITWGSGTSKIFFYTDFNWTRRAYRWYNNKLWYLNNVTWTDIGTFSANELEFNTIKLPIMLNGSTPTTYTTPIDWGWAEKVAISASDPWFWVVWTNVGKTLIVLSDTASSSYKWVFWTIIDNDWTYYTLLWGWITNTTTGLSSWGTYKVYDTVWEYLQVMDWISNDRYFSGITEHAPFAWLATSSLRVIQAIKSNQFVTKQISFNSSIWTFNKTTLYFSSWELNNPFFYNFTGALTLPVTWDIADIFTFKNRLVVAGTNFVIVVNRNYTYDIVSQSFWMKKGSLVDLWEDMYYLWTDWEIKSLSENIAWTIISTNIWKSVMNYTKNFLTKISSGFNGRKMFLYWQVDSNTVWTVVVFDLTYKYWSVYTWLRPASFVFENWITYMTDNNSDKVRRFDDTVFTDLWVQIEQKISIKEIDLWDVFSIKSVQKILVWLDNFTQEAYLDVYMSLAWKNTRKSRKVVSLQEVDVNADPAPPIWEWEVWENILWGNSYTPNISYPFIMEISLPMDKAYIWKVIITWKDGSPFYLNEMDVEVNFSWLKRAYFSPNHTF